MKLRYKILIVIVVLLVLGYIFYPFLLEKAAQFLIVQDELKKSDVIIVLGGDDNGERIRQAAELYHKGYAKYFLMSGGQVYWRVTITDLMSKHAEKLGIPKSAILVEDKSESTRENATFCLPIVKQHNFKSIILVTSPTHSRRSRLTFRRIFEKEGIHVLCYPVQESEFKLKEWWNRHEDSQKVVLEYVKLIGYYLKGW